MSTSARQCAGRVGARRPAGLRQSLPTRVASQGLGLEAASGPSLARKLQGGDQRLSVRPRSAFVEEVSPVEITSDEPNEEALSKASVLQKVFHIVAFAQTFSVWFWHFTPASHYLPAASLFGYFFRYLTFCTYTLQVLYLGFAIVSDFTGKVRYAPPRAMARSPAIFSGRRALSLGSFHPAHT